LHAKACWTLLLANNNNNNTSNVIPLVKIPMFKSYRTNWWNKSNLTIQLRHMHIIVFVVSIPQVDEVVNFVTRKTISQTWEHNIVPMQLVGCLSVAVVPRSKRHHYDITLLCVYVPWSSYLCPDSRNDSVKNCLCWSTKFIMKKKYSIVWFYLKCNCRKSRVFFIRYIKLH